METLQLLQELDGHTDRVWNLAWTPEGEQLASCSGDKTVRLWSKQEKPGSWTCSALLDEMHQRTIRSCSWSPGGRLLATASFDATVGIWKSQGGVWTQIAVLEGHENEVKGVAWSPSGTVLATCGRDKTVWFWESLPGNEFECIDVKYGHSQDVKYVCWHPSEQILVSTSYDDSIKLWAEEDGEWSCQQTLGGGGSGHSATVWSVAFSPDGTKMASCSDDTTLRIWECHFARGFRDPKWRLLTNLSGYHSASIFSVSWSKDGFIATASRDNGVRVFRETGQCADEDPSSAPVFELVACAENAHTQDVNCVAWHPIVPALLASAGDDEAVKLWELKMAPS